MTDLPVLQAKVTEHRLHRVACPACGAQTRDTLPPEVPAGAFGARQHATIAVFSGCYRLSHSEVADVCETVLDAPLCVGSVDGVCQATGDALAAPAATLPEAAVPYADESGWRQAGQGR